MNSITYKDKKCKTEHHVIGMGGSMSQKKTYKRIMKNTVR